MVRIGFNIIMLIRKVSERKVIKESDKILFGR